MTTIGQAQLIADVNDAILCVPLAALTAFSGQLNWPLSFWAGKVGGT